MALEAKSAEGCPKPLKTTWATEANSASGLPADLIAEMTRLYVIGFSLLPLGGKNGKTPLVRFKDRKRLPLDLVIRRMTETGSRSYGIRLNGLLVIDVDRDTFQAQVLINERFGASPVKVRTRRGYHLYFGHSGSKPRSIREPDIAIDFKVGANEYIVGPLSIRPDGTVYRPERTLIAPGQLPRFKDAFAVGSSPSPIAAPGIVTEGHRHHSLNRRAYELAVSGYPLADLTRELLAWRDHCLDRPEDFSDDRVAGIASWYCDRRDAGQLWSGSHSIVPIARSAIDLLLTSGNGLATQLYLLLSSAHGAQATAPFAIVPDALLATGRLKAGRGLIYRAIACLTELGLLVVAQPSRRPKDPILYLLAPAGALGARGEV